MHPLRYRVVATCAAFVIAACDDSPLPQVDRDATPPPVGTSPVPPAASCAAGFDDVVVASEDLNGYPPYAVEGCSLVYVSGSGDLVLRDLAVRGAGGEQVLASAQERPRRPAISRALVAFEAEVRGARVVRIVPREPRGAAYTIEGPFAMAGEPRVRGDAVVFTAWQATVERSDSDVWLHVAGTRETNLAIGGRGQQRFADVSEGVVVATDFSEDADGFYDGSGADLADITVLDRKTSRTTKRAAPGKQAFPMLGDGDLLAYLSWSTVHPEPKLVAYDLLVGSIFGPATADRKIASVTFMSSEYARPAVHGKMLEWVANPDGRTALHRAPLDGSAEPQRVNGLDGLQLFAPAPADGFTVLATSARGAVGGAPKLRSIGR
ncbi:MAG: hypothetical protein JST00_14845 [Deltaproteobacteria bacterium]|nr:hypothetical protein [Deltaproteobacteria bacterium]